jgi:hypothetical protein
MTCNKGNMGIFRQNEIFFKNFDNLKNQNPSRDSLKNYP